MNLDCMFFVYSIIFGVCLSLDNFALSITNGMNKPQLNIGRIFKIAAKFGFFQAFMFISGRICVSVVVMHFAPFKLLIPQIALVLLLYVGMEMLIKGIFINNKNGEEALKSKTLLIQSIALSADAFSAGCFLTDLCLTGVAAVSIVTAAATFIVSAAGLAIGSRFGKISSDTAQILDGFFLSISGLKVFMAGVLLSA